MGNIVTGTRTSKLSTPTNQAQDMDRVMHYVQDYQTPIQQFYVFNKDASKPVTNKRSKFEWHEKTAIARTFLIDALVGAGGTTGTFTLATADSGLLRMGDTLFVESTGQIFIVTGSSDPTVSATVRLVASTGTILAIAASAVIRIINSAKKEDYARQGALTKNADPKYGYCQIGLDAVAMSGREDAGEAMTDGESFTDLMLEKSNEIAKYEERKYLYNGVPWDDTTNNITYSGGARGMITTNVGYYDGDVDESELEDQLELIMAKNDGGEVIGYCGAKYAKGLNKFLKEAYQYNTNDIISVYGGITKKGTSDPTVLKYLSLWGAVKFVLDPMLEGDVYGNACLFLNKKHHRLRYMKNDSRGGTRKYRVEPNVQDPGTGVIQDQIMWDTGLEINEEVMHGWHLKRA